MFTSLFRRGPRATATRRFRLEALEDRSVPALLLVGASDPYQTIGSAMAAASPGDTIRVNPGTYQEAVNITKDNITLEGASQAAVILSPDDLTGNQFSLVRVNGAKNVTIRNLTVSGPYTGGFTDVNGRLLGMHAGIFVANNGSATITGNHITQIRDAVLSTTVNDGFGILVGSKPEVLNTVGTAYIANNRIDNYQKVGIDVVNAGSFANIVNNTVVGLGLPVANETSLQLGIGVEAKARALISYNTVTNNVQTTATAYGIGIYILPTGSGSIVGNTVTGNREGIRVQNTFGGLVALNQANDNIVTGIVLVNTVGLNVFANQANRNLFGFFLFNCDNSFLAGNESNGNGYAGFLVDAASQGNRFIQNRMSGNAVFDAVDDSVGSGTAGTANLWIGNFGLSDNRGGGLFGA